MPKIVIRLNGEGHELPARWDVCGDCEGESRTWPESLRHDVLEREDRDDEFIQDLFNGVYDVVCKTCKGRTTVLVVDEDALSHTEELLYEEWQLAQAEEADYFREEERLRRAERGR